MLRGAGIAFTVSPVRLDEAALRDALAGEGAGPHDIADALAEMKALRAAARRPDALCLGADQILSVGTDCLGKPGTPDEAMAQLSRLSGNTHVLHSALVAVEDSVPVWRHVGTARITFHPLSDGEIASYVARTWDQIRHSVGGYLIEGEGVRLMSRIEGDHFTIMGLPLLPLLTWLRVRGDITA